jgi:lycopene beta-cyclase
MTYFAFLALFVGLPILILLGLTWRDARRGRRLPNYLGSYPAGLVLLAHVLIALIYTTPWDNYLVATGVWWYNPELVTGLTLGWVPIEEYTFFIVQPIMTGLWFLLWARRLAAPTGRRWVNRRLRFGLLAAGGLLWLAMIASLVSGWSPGTYLALQLAWALPPILLQIGFGADILWRYKRIVLLGLLPPTLYLAAADSVAIGAGTWTIDPAQSLHWLIGGVLPVEEFLFFLVTNTLLVFGMTLVLATESQVRLGEWKRRLGGRTGRAAPQEG